MTIVREAYHGAITEPGPWINDPSRACNGLDTEAFFPDVRFAHEEVRRAKRVCAHCVVKAECLDYALNAHPRVFGIWGGTTDGQRIRLRQQAKKEAA